MFIIVKYLYLLRLLFTAVRLVTGDSAGKIIFRPQENTNIIIFLKLKLLWQDIFAQFGVNIKVEKSAYEMVEGSPVWR